MRSISLEVPEMSKKKGSNRCYDKEFKQDVLRLVDEGRPIVEVAASLGLRPELIYTWNSKRKREMGAAAYAASSGKELTPEEEIKALKEELVTTRRERDILKKALAIFSKEPLNH
jgi:transposase